MASLTIDRVCKRFGHVEILKEIDIAIDDGEFLVLVGPSGCGKSTLLTLIAGLETISEGEIRIDRQRVNELHPKDRDIAMVFQNYALYPHMTVYDNIGFALKLARVPKEEIDTRVRKAAAILELDKYLDRKPGQLSGGQRQRVAMGRAIVRSPKAFLMDEPLSNLDAKLRTTMRAELARLHERLGITTVYVTHDQVEAMTLGQRVAVLRDGVLQQFGDPQELFHRPVNLFVAAFIGSPTMNLVSARCDGERVAFAGSTLPLPPDLAGTQGDVVLGLRPGAFDLAGAWTDPELPRMEVEAEVVEALGDEALVSFRVDAPAVEVEEVRTDDGRLLADDSGTRFVARVRGRVGVRTGERLTLAVDHRELHLFDPQSGRALREAASPAGPRPEPAH